MTCFLVTGGAGFIGSYIVDALIKEGHRVVVIDNLAGGQRQDVNPQAEFHQLDVNDLAAITPCFVGIDGVFHLAALPRVPFSVDHPMESHQANLNGTFNVLLAARQARVKRLVYSASSTAYGPQATMPLQETMAPNPLSPYAVQKLAGEYYVKVFGELYNLETVALRYFSVYGPRQRGDGGYAMAIGKFIDCRLQNKSLPIHGDGQQTRDFTHVRDVVRANLLAMSSPKVGRGEIINICGGAVYSIKKIAELIGGQIEFQPRRPADVDHVRGDATKARELLGWQPQENFEASLKELLKLHNLEA